MNFNEIMEVIRDLAKHQGFYGRLLETIEDAQMNEFDKFDEMVRVLEEQDFKDVVDIVLFFEC